MLNNEEKNIILDNLINNYESNIFRLEQERDAEISLLEPSQGVIDNLNYQIDSLSTKITYLESVKNQLL